MLAAGGPRGAVVASSNDSGCEPYRRKRKVAMRHVVMRARLHAGRNIRFSRRYTKATDVASLKNQVSNARLLHRV